MSFFIRLSTAFALIILLMVVFLSNPVFDVIRISNPGFGAVSCNEQGTLFSAFYRKNNDLGLRLYNRGGQIKQNVSLAFFDPHPRTVQNNVSFSPDQSKLAFIVNENNPKKTSVKIWDLNAKVVLDLADSGALGSAGLAADSRSSGGIGWLENNTIVYETNAGEIVVSNFDTKEITQTFSGSFSPSLSHVRTRLAFFKRTKKNFTLHIYNFATEMTVSSLNLEAPQGVRWSPDDKLVLILNKAVSGSVLNERLDVIETQSGRVVFSLADHAYGDPSWVDGSKFMVSEMERDDQGRINFKNVTIYDLWKKKTFTLPLRQLGEAPVVVMNGGQDIMIHMKNKILITTFDRLSDLGSLDQFRALLNFGSTRYIDR